MIRAVLDTNILVSSLLKPLGAPGEVLRWLRKGAFIAVFSPELLDEIASVLMNPKIRSKYGITRRDLETVSSLFALRGEMTGITGTVQGCRDPDDNFLIETALAGRADFIVTGDEDLLILKKHQKIRIVKPDKFLVVIESAVGCRGRLSRSKSRPRSGPRP